jgi:hypothetical protein
VIGHLDGSPAVELSVTLTKEGKRKKLEQILLVSTLFLCSTSINRKSRHHPERGLQEEEKRSEKIIRMMVLLRYAIMSLFCWTLLCSCSGCLLCSDCFWWYLPVWERSWTSPAVTLESFYSLYSSTLYLLLSTTTLSTALSPLSLLSLSSLLLDHCGYLVTSLYLYSPLSS